MEQFRKIEIESSVKDLVASVTRQPLWEIHIDLRLKKDLDLDSLDVVELTVMAQKMFGVELNDKQADKLETVSDLVNIVLDYIDKWGKLAPLYITRPK